VDVVAVIGTGEPARIGRTVRVPAVDELGRTQRTGGGQPRRRAMDLAIAATANVNKVHLITHNVTDFKIIEDLVDVHAP
jgi:predicted nucleic acid-binding protein